MITHKIKGNRMNIGIDIDDTINRLSDILPQYAIKYNEENKIDYEEYKEKCIYMLSDKIFTNNVLGKDGAGMLAEEY